MPTVSHMETTKMTGSSLTTHRTSDSGRAQEVASAVGRLGQFAATASLDDLPDALQERLRLSLIDNLGLTIAGHALDEVKAIVAAWNPQSGPAHLFGTGRRTGVDDAAWLNGIAVCINELDEGNKHARGHPVTHVISAAVAVATERQATGRQLLEAVMVGGEVSARFGRAMEPSTGLHTHGHWGNTGAAAAVGRLMGLGPEALAGAIDAAGGLVLATPFESALRGTFVRNTWLGAANALGLVAARMAAAGVASVDGTAAFTLGALLGRLDASALTEDLGARWDTGTGYFKRHASCSYTHPPADAALELRGVHGPIDPASVSSILIETHGLATPLDRTEVPTRLASMFSIPHVVAVALHFGDCRPVRFDEAHRTDPLIRQLVGRTTVSGSSDFDARLPRERGARVTVTLTDGRALVAEVPNPIGDADYHPFARRELLEKLDGLLEGTGLTAAAVAEAVDQLPSVRDSSSVFATLC
jgi:2-methylcitrate dehydratase PrpD